jgi:hypothetical protein
MPPRPNDSRRAVVERAMKSATKTAAKPCIAIVTESVERPGFVAFHLMGCSAPCPKCDDARARLLRRHAPPAPEAPQP